MAVITPPTIPTTYPFQSQLTPNLTNFLLIPVGMYVYFITYPQILITSPTAILNTPINSLCPLDPALVLTSDDFQAIFPPTLPVSHPLWWHSFESITWCHLYHMITYIYSLLIEKDICDCQNVPIKLPCVSFNRRSLHF
jgi:hypothetical protein